MKDPVKWGIISTARITRRGGKAMSELSMTELVGVASRNLSRAERVARDLGAKMAFGSYEEMLASDEIDAVYIAVPNSLHAKWAIRAAEAGKHVLCQKPLTSNSREAELVVEACEREGVLLKEAFMYRHHPQHTKVKDIISSGRIGEPLVVNTRFSFYLEPSDNIRWSEKLSGGALMDLGCYCINVSRLIFESEPINAKALVKYNESYRVDETTLALLEFSRDRYASFTCSLLMHRVGQYEVIGTDGSIEVTNAFVPRLHEKPIDVLVRVKDKSETEEIVIQAIDQYRLEIEHFSKCILEGSPLTYPAENGLANMRAIDLVRKGLKRSL